MAAIRSFIKIQPITGRSGIAQNMDQVRKSINRMGSVTDGIAKSFYDTTELLKFEKQYLSDTSKEEVSDLKTKDKKDKTKWTKSMRDFRRTFRKKKRDRLENEAEKGVEEGKEEGRKAVKKEAPKMGMLGRFLSGIFRIFKYFIIFGALNWLSNPKNAQNAVKVFKVLFTIGKFAFKVTKMGVGMILDGLTNVFGNYKDEGAIKRGFRGILGVAQLMGGLAVLRTAQYMIMPWKILKDVNRLRMIFESSGRQSAEQDANQKIRKSGYRDKKTGVIYSKEEYEKMKKSAAKADRKNPGAKKAFEGRFGKESRFSKFKGKASAARKRFGAGANKAFGKLGGKLNVGMSVVGGAGRIAAGLASGEKASSAVGAGVGQGIGGLVGGIAGTALLGPFLGPFAPIVGNAIGSFLGEWVGKELGPIMEPIFGPIGQAFKMMFDVVKMTIGPLFQQIAEPLGLIFNMIGQLGKVLMDAAKVLSDFAGFIFGGLMDAIGGTVQFVVNNAKRLMNPASVAGGIADALTFNLFDFDKENKKAAGGPVKMAGGGALQFGSHPDMLGMVGGLYLKSIVGSFGAFGFVGNKVKSVLAPDIQRIASGLGVNVSTSGGGTAGGVSNSVQFQAPQTERKQVENIKNLSYKEGTYKAIHDGLNKLLINGIKIFDPAKAAEIEKKRNSGAGQTPSSSSAGQIPSKKPPAGGVEGGWAPVLNLILKYESGSGGYDAMYPGTTLPGASKMPIAKVAQQATGAVGAWQNLPEYLNQRAVAVGLDPKTDLYNAENQQKIAEYLIGPGQAQVSKQMAKENPKEAMLRLSRVWAAIPKNDSGLSYYAGDGVNVAHIKPDMMYAAFQELAKGGKLKTSDPKYREKWSGDGRKTILKEYSAGGEAIIAGAKKIIGQGRGTADQCANTTRLALEMAKHPAANKRTQKGDLDTPQGTAYNGASFAASFGGSDMGTVIRNKAQIKMGDIILWKADRDLGGSSNKGAITHVGIAADDGLRNQYDHNTSRGWHYRPHWDASQGTSWLAGIRLGGKPGTIGDTKDSDSTKKSISSSDSGGEADDLKPKTVEGMLEAFKTGLKNALTKISSAAPPASPKTESSTPTASVDNIKALGSVRDNAVTQLKTIRDKAQRDEEATGFVPVVTERLVIQKVKQTINTGGSTSAVYTKPSPLLSK